MPFDPENPKSISRLAGSIEKSQRHFRKHMAVVRKMKKVYVGHLYSEEGSPEAVPVNLVEQHVGIYNQNLVPNTPSAFVTVTDSSLLARRGKLEASLDFLAELLDLQRVLADSVFDAQFLMGVAKVGINADAVSPRAGFSPDSGQPFVQHVLLEDWLHDYFASSMETAEYSGDRRWMEIEEVKDLYPKHADQLEATSWSEHGREDDKGATPIPSHAADAERVQDYIDIWEIYYRPANLILRMPGGRDGVRKIVLNAAEWSGPKRGPYHTLGFKWIPGSTIPLSPLTTLFELSRFHDALFEKSHNQAEQQKTVLAARRAHHQDARKVTGGADMEVVTVGDDPNLIKDFRLGGADPQTLEMARLCRELFSSFAGNLELMGGLAAQSETFSQDRLLATNASKRIQTMSKAVRAFSRGIFEDLGWWLWGDLETVISTTRKSYGGAPVSVQFGPQDRTGSYYDFNVDVNPYSDVARTPQEEFQVMMEFVQQLFIPGEQNLAAQGVAINWVNLYRRMGELRGLKTMDEYIMFSGKQGMPQSKATGNPPTPQATVGGNGKAAAGPSFGGQDFQQQAGAVARMISGDGGQRG